MKYVNGSILSLKNRKKAMLLIEMQEFIWVGGRNRNCHSFDFEKCLPFKKMFCFQKIFFFNVQSFSSKRNCPIMILPGYFHHKISIWRFDSIP